MTQTHTVKRALHTLDATGQAPGRLATQIAMLLRGKNKPTFEYHIDAGDAVKVINVRALKIAPKKLEQKKYYHHTMYPGGLKTKSMKTMWQEKPRDVLRAAVWRMLPKTSHRMSYIKRLDIE